MLLTKNVEITINPNNYKYLKSIGFSELKINDKIIIPTNNLSKGSGKIVEVVSKQRNSFIKKLPITVPVMANNILWCFFQFLKTRTKSS